MRIALLQINPTAGDIGGNSALIVQGARRAQAEGVQLAVTTELALMGYLPRDLLMSQGFVRRSCEALRSIAQELADATDHLLQNTALREELAEKGRRRAGMFRWSDTAQRTWSLYEEALRRPGRGPDPS